MSNTAFDQQISLFRFHINNKRFDDETIRILESALISKDVKSLIEVRSCLREFLRPESVTVIREISEKSVQQKLFILDFFVRAFALIGDVQSCLALRYEALTLRDLKSASCEWLQVSHIEWLHFAEQSLENGFCAIAGKACENAQSCLRFADLETDEMSEITEKIKRMKNHSVTLATSCSGYVMWPSRFLIQPALNSSKWNLGIPHATTFDHYQFYSSSVQAQAAKSCENFKACGAMPVDHTLFKIIANSPYVHEVYSQVYITGSTLQIYPLNINCWLWKSKTSLCAHKNN
ncbi:hypothetical protein QYF36_022741 [Acer negundo]|nr:hypothetical protein QYF36_022741 [Acer negundo]